MNEKKKILIYRLVWFAITIVWILSLILILACLPQRNETRIILSIALISTLFIPIVFFIISLLLSYKEYNVDGKLISVYSGFYRHTLRVNGELCDEHNTDFSFIPIELSTTYDNDLKIKATISLSNQITVKVNDKLIKPKQPHK